MNLFQRLLIFIFTLLIIASTFLLAIHSFRILPLIFLEDMVIISYGNYGVGVISLLLFILAIYLLQPLTIVKEKGEALIAHNELGRLQVSLEAIKDLVKKDVKGREGIEQVKAQLNWLEDGLQINLRLKVFPQLELPGLTSEIQSSLKDHIQRLTGVKINGVQILVEEITPEVSKTPSRVG